MSHRTLADRLVLCPSTDPLPTDGKEPVTVPFDGHHVEGWVQRNGTVAGRDVRLFVLKFSGAGGRAERSNGHPAELWPDVATETWSVNPPGYGGSGGPASLRRMAPAARAVFEAIARVADGRPILVAGNSLGATIALHLGTRFPVAGLLLRNPPPLRQLITRRHGWWNLWLPAMAVARGVPTELDAVRNAAANRSPAVFVASERDETVPPRYQRMIAGSYAGEKRVFAIPGARHATPVPEAMAGPYTEHLRWLLDRALG